VTAREFRDEGGLSRFSLDRRISLLVLFLTLLVVGAAATTRIPVELFPSGYDDPFLMVYIPWENAPAKEVLDKVIIPLEEELSTVRGMSDIFTRSNVGDGRTYMWFKHGTDMKVAYREVRDRIERARARFPDDIDRVYIFKDDASGIPVQVIGVAVDPAIPDAYDLIQNVLVKRLQRVDGVASVEVNGLEEKEILIELDREKTAAAGLNIWELAQGLGSDNFTMASGTVREGSRKLLLRSLARYRSLDELENRLVGPNARLKDVATIAYRQPEQRYRVRAMSRPAVGVAVMKEGEANVKEVSNAVTAELEALKRDPRFATVWMVTLLNQGEIIDESLRTLFNSGMIGGLIAVAVLLFFLRRFRLTVIIAFSIPLSILIGLTVMYFGGESLNLLTLLGLMICVGLLVDNSVVVAENIHRLHRDGFERRRACIEGAGEVSLAIIMSTLTTIVVFAPVALVGGPGQFFLLRLAMPVCVSVAASLFIALVFVPLCVYLTLPLRNGNGGPGRFRQAHDRGVEMVRRAYEATFGRLSRGYTALLAFFLRRRVDLMLAIVAVFMVTYLIPMSGQVLDRQVEFVGTQEEERGGFGLTVEFPPATTLEETEEWFLEAEKIVESKAEELDLAGWFHVHEKTDGRVRGWFNRPRTNKKITPAEATRIVMEALPKRAGMEITVEGEEEGREDEGTGEVHVVSIRGEDPDLLDRVKNDLEDVFRKVDGVLGIRGGNEPPPNELGVVVNRERAQRYQVNPEHVAGVVRTALMGVQLPKYHEDGKEIPVRVRYREEDRESLTELADFMVPTMRGEMLPLSAVTDAEFLPAPQTIGRFNKRMTRSISMELEGDEDGQKTRERLMAIQAGIDLPEGVTFAANFQQQDLDEDLAALRFAGFLSIVLIYLLMGFLFESFILPLSIIFTIPLSIIGVYWSHFFTGKDIDFLGVVAMILLVGVVVNNGIVLIDYVNRLRHQGHARQEAVLGATSRRFRPIMMTAITTIGGLIPLALAGSSSIGISYKSFSMTLIGGMTTATLLTLLVVPVFYTMFDDAREACSVALRGALGSARRKAAAEPTAV
jgi:HAE1 family hydrophobic/amphiphilic exporter-1